MGSTASRLEPLWGGSWLFTIKFPEIPGTHSIDFRRMKDWNDTCEVGLWAIDLEWKCTVWAVGWEGKIIDADEGAAV